MGAITRRSSLSLQPQGSRRHKPDYWLLMISALLLAIGLIVVYAISPGLAVENHVSGSYYVTHQIIAVVLGVIAFGITATIPVERWRQWYKPLLIAAGLLTLVALIMPKSDAYPAHRWIRLGSFSFQSVELLKLALLAWVAGMLSERIAKDVIRNVKETLKPILIGFVVVGVVVAGVQQDFGSMMVITAMITAMVFVAGVPLKRIAFIGAVLLIGGILAVSAVPYRRARIEAYLHQGSTTNCASLKNGYQACQALITVGSGGMVGLGLGKSVQAFGYLPEAQNDSIFAIYAEKFGFIGAGMLLGVFLAFFARLKRIMEMAPDDFTRLLATGIFAWLAGQSLINIGAMVGVLPLKGITLPFISYGGTSVLFVMAAVGMAFQISRYTLFSRPRQTEGISGRNTYENSRDRRRVGGPHYPSTRRGA